MDLKKIKWIAARLRVMRPAEIIHRFIEVLVKQYLGVRPASRLPLPITTAAIGFHYFRRQAQFGNEVSARDVTYQTMRQGPTVFGRSWPKNEEGKLDWHTSISGESYNNVKAFKVRYRSRDSWQDDIRQVWELNRLVWLIPIAFTAAATNEYQVKNYLRIQINSFIESDLPGFSARWNSAIEIAIQALSLMSIERVLGPIATEIMPSGYLDALKNRYKWLLLLPSKFSSENNHRVAELAAVIAIADRLSIDGARAYRRAEDFSNLIKRLFAADGFTTEQSFGYQLFTLDLVATLKLLVPNLDLGYSAESRISSAVTAVSQIYQFCGFWPSANDSDEAQLMGVLDTQGSPPYELYSSAFGLTQKVQVPKSILHFKDAGYLFLKSSTRGQQVILMVDHGSMGLAPLYAHAHADLQAVWLWVGKQPILVESGTYCYHASESFRALLQGSLSHNSISIDKESIALPNGPFLWHQRTLPRALQYSLVHSQGKYDVHMSCEVFMRGFFKQKAVWTRELTFSALGLKVTDSLVASRPAELGVQFIVAPEFIHQEDKRQPLFFRMNDLEIQFLSDGIKTQVEDFPISPNYGHLAMATRIQNLSSNKNVTTTHIRIRSNA